MKIAADDRVHKDVMLAKKLEQAANLKKDRVSRENAVKVKQLYGSAGMAQVAIKLDETSTFSNYIVQKLEWVNLDAKKSSEWRT